MFLNLVDVKGGVHVAYPAALIKRFDDQVRIRAKFFKGKLLLWGEIGSFGVLGVVRERALNLFQEE